MADNRNPDCENQVSDKIQSSNPIDSKLIDVNEKKINPNKIILDEETEGYGNIQRQWNEEAENIKTSEELKNFIDKLINNYSHDYGTIINAVTTAFKAMFRVFDKSEEGGFSGFQVSLMMWSIIRYLTRNDDPKTLLMYERMLWPQHKNDFISISQRTFNWLQDKAKEYIEKYKSREGDEAWLLWKSIIAGYVPYGLKLDEESVD